MHYFDNHFLFSETYIKEFIKNESKKKDNDDVLVAFNNIKEWNSEFTDGDYSSYPWRDYINAVLDVLRFEKNVLQSSIELFARDFSNNKIMVAICYVIDKDLEISCTKKGMYFAYDAVQAAKKCNVEWAMLTNGYQWRLYHTKNVSPYENYLEIDIEESIKNNSAPDEAFKLFHLFFNSKTFTIDEGELIIEKIKVLSDKKAEIIEESLRGKAEEILKELCYGLKENMNQEHYTENEKKSIYNDAIILLYRLLFFGYAESRKLLPIIADDPEYNYSFKQLCEEAKELQNSGSAHKTKDEFDFWDRLDTHIRIYVDRSYNGGLFHNDDKEILKKNRIANGRFSKCLAELAYNRDKSGYFSIPIEYKDLSVRNLGSIYEGLLEYRLFIAEEQMVQRKSKGQVKYLRAADVKLQNSDVKNLIEKGGIYLSQDALERKETGAYYTPEDVVEYIVENTVGKKLDELRAELKNQKKDLLEQLEYENDGSSLKRGLQNQIDEITIKFIHEKVLALSIIDSAMGSGHFLVNAAYRVANEIVDVISENKWETTNDDIIADVIHWKRKVVENCIYGIDINGLSVALARLSLWLISASNNKALSFLDHHLKEGNSIIGTDRKHVEVRDASSPVLDVTYTDYMKEVLRKYDELKAIGSNTKSDVAKQKEIYEEIIEELKVVKKKYDYYLASKYMGVIDDRVKYFNLLRSSKVEEFDKSDLNSLWNIAKEKKFFHWELEFPEVFISDGFDIVIGNPPYVEADCGDYIEIEKTKQCHNLYAYMIETNLKKMKKRSYLGVILPTACLSTPRMSSLQNLLIENSSNIFFSTYDDRPAKIFLRLESMRVAIITAQVSKESEARNVYTTKYNRWYSEERKELFTGLKFVKLTNYMYVDGYLPKVGSIHEDSIYQKIFNKKKNIGHYVSEKTTNNAVYYGYGVRYWIKAMSRSPEEIDTIQRKSTGDKRIDFEQKYSNKIITALLNSSIFFLYFTSFSDARNLTKNTITNFPFVYEELTEIQKCKIVELSDRLMDDYINNSVKKTCNYAATGEITYREYYIKKSKNIIDEIDEVLANYYEFSPEELNYVKNFELRFRLGKEMEEEPYGL